METENNALMLVDDNGSFEMDDAADMDVDGNDNNAMTVFTPTTPITDGDESALLDPDTQPNKRRRKKSIVWEHFTIETVSPGSTKACCKHCKKSFAYITGSKMAGTSHLKRHIALGICPVSRQNTQLAQTPETKTRSTGPPKKRYRSSPGYTNIPLDQERCNHEMAKMIIMHEYPLHMVEHPGFAGFVQTLQPQFSMASFNTIHGDCVSMYLLEKQKLSDFIREIPGRVNLTLDLWASNQTLGYAFLTGHFIDNDWNLHRRLLNVLIVPSPDSDFAFNQSVAACLSDWNLERRVSSLTVDKSIANEVAIENLRGFLSVRNPHVLHGQLLIGKCYARLLSSMAQDALASEELETPIKKVRDSVKYVKTNDSHEDRFYEVKRQLRIPSTKEILIDDQTKWNTTYSMLIAACEHKEVFSCLETCDPEYRMAPTFEEWRKIEILCGCLKLLFEAANVLTGPTHPTANELYHEVTKLQLELTHAAINEDPEVRNLANPLREKFDDFWKGCFLVLAVAVVMDPRFKMKLIEFSFSKIYGEDAGQWIKTVDDGIHDLYLDYTAQHYPLLDAYVDHGNNGVSETELSQEVHFHNHELPHERHHSNGVLHDRTLDKLPQEVNPVYEQPQPSDTNPQLVQPQDHALNGHSQDGHPPDEQPQEGRTSVDCEHPSHEPQASDAQPHGGESVAESLPKGQECEPAESIPPEAQPAEATPQEGQLMSTLSLEDQQIQALPREGQPCEPLPQEGLSREGQPSGPESPGDHPMDGLSQEGQLADAVPPKHHSVEQESQAMEGQTQESQLTEGPSQEGQLVEEMPQESHPVDETSHKNQPTEHMAEESRALDGMPHESLPIEHMAEESRPLEGMHQEREPLEDMPEEKQTAEGFSQEGQSMESLAVEAHPPEGLPQEPQITEGLPQEPQDTEDQPQEPQNAEVLPQEAQNVEGLPQEAQNTEGLPQEPQITEGLPQEPQDTEDQPQEPQNAEVLPQEAQNVEGLPPEAQNKWGLAQEPQNTEGLPQEPQNISGLPQEPQNTEDLAREPQNMEGLPQESQPSKGLREEVHVLDQPQACHDSQSLPHVDHHSFELSHEGHHVDILLQEGHHLEASSQDFPLITIGDGFSDFELYISEISSHQQMKSELDQYLEESLMPRSQEFNILGWWKLNRTKYPTLSKMAADVLSVPFTTLTPDSVFDTKMKKMDSYRSSLRPVTLEALICAKDWFRFGSSTSENIHGANMKTES